MFELGGIEWPAGSVSSTAIATRILFLNSLAEYISFNVHSADQQKLLSIINWSTDPLENTIQDLNDCVREMGSLISYRLGALAPNHELHAALGAIATLEPIDLIGQLFEEVKLRVGAAYGQEIEVPLRTQLLRADVARTAIRGGTPQSREYVDLVIYEHFDLTALALLPYVLTHELVSHVMARHIGDWSDVPDPDIRDFFSEGLMDRASWFLLYEWIEDGDIAALTHAGHLAEAETPYSVGKPVAFSAGKAAWWNCIKRVGEHRMQSNQHAPEEDPFMPRPHTIVLNASLALNSCPSPLPPKDTFVYELHTGATDALGMFVDMTTGQTQPADLLADMPL